MFFIQFRGRKPKTNAQRQIDDVGSALHTSGTYPNNQPGPQGKGSA
jgi:hypothetical protein